MQQYVIAGQMAEPFSLSHFSNSAEPRVLPKIDAVNAATCQGFTVKELTSHFARLRNEFGAVARKIEALTQLSCLKRPGCGQLAQLSKQTRQLAHVVQRDLQRGAELRAATFSDSVGIEQFPDPIRIDQLIEQCSDYQDRIQRQLGLVAQLREIAAELRSELNLLAMRGRERAGSLSFDGVKALTRRIISELVCDVTPPVLHPQLALDVLVELFGNRADAEIHAVAFATAQSVARVARVTWLRADQVELVTAAALLQDCGKLLTPPSNPSCLTIHAPQLADHHPLIGSAIISGYRDAPVRLATLVAQHHERLNGTGHPFRLSDKQLSGFARLVAVASRLERLRLRFAFDSDLLTAPDQAERPAMVQLWAEANAGAWDLNLTRKLLVQRDAPLELQNSLDQSFTAPAESEDMPVPPPLNRLPQQHVHNSASHKRVRRPTSRVTEFRSKTGS